MRRVRENRQNRRTEKNELFRTGRPAGGDQRKYKEVGVGVRNTERTRTMVRVLLMCDFDMSSHSSADLQNFFSEFKWLWLSEKTKLTRGS